ncbi:MAG TPA: protein kinase [Telluria sp.]|nr:protein kinase [Telluria sp.]
MTRHLHEPANALLYRALDLPPEERQQFIADACADEPDLLELVRTLLARIDALDEFLESPLDVPAAPLLRFPAAPSSPESAPNRPELDFPDIAPLPDARNAADGVPIDRYCADMKLTLRQRAALFARACDAVQYVHQHLVIHRDLKPSNLVVGADGTPRLIGFKMAGEGGSPVFASPEQLAGERLSTASDIYSLGAILYGLLSGRSPNPAEATGILSTLARPPSLPPSEAVAEAVARHYPPLADFPADDLLRADPKLVRQLQGDLDHILMKSIATDPAQRYASADAFARDLDRYAAEQPVVAAASQRGAKRHPLATVVAVVAAVALLAGTGAVLWHARQADAARALAEQRLAQPLKPAVVAPSAVAGKPAPAAPRQVEAPKAQDGKTLIEQGRTAEGLAELRKVLASREQIAAGDAANAQAARDVADAHWAIGTALAATMDHAAAEPELTAARDTYAAQLRANPADAGLRAGLIDIELARASVQNLQRHGRDTVQTLASLRTLARDPDAYLAARIALLEAYIQPRGTPARAFASAGQALSELLKQSESDPLDGAKLRQSALAWQTAGEIGLRAGQTEAACRYLALAAKRYDEFEAAKSLNAIDKLRQAQVQDLRKACS